MVIQQAPVESSFLEIVLHPIVRKWWRSIAWEKVAAPFQLSRR